MDFRAGGQMTSVDESCALESVVMTIGLVVWGIIRATYFVQIACIWDRRYRHAPASDCADRGRLPRHGIAARRCVSGQFRGFVPPFDLAGFPRRFEQLGHQRWARLPWRLRAVWSVFACLGVWRSLEILSVKVFRGSDRTFGQKPANCPFGFC